MYECCNIYVLHNYILAKKVSSYSAIFLMNIYVSRQFQSHLSATPKEINMFHEE